jgi:uncharacterized protein
VIALNHIVVVKKNWLCLLFCLLFSTALWALAVPTLTGPVVDLAGVLNSGEREQLGQQIRAIHARGLAQMQILLIPSLEGDVLEEYSMRVAEAWKIGTKKVDNGLIILLAIKDRAIRIEVGGGIEGAIPDLAANRVIDSMKPFLKEGRYAAALQLALEKLTQRLSGDKPGDALPPALVVNNQANDQMPDRSTMIGFLVLFFLFLTMLPRWPRLVVGEGILGTSMFFGGVFTSPLFFVGALLVAAVLLLSLGELLFQIGIVRVLMMLFFNGRGGGGGSGSGGGSWGGGGGNYSGGGSSGRW